jgi:hypothetical protein
MQNDIDSATRQIDESLGLNGVDTVALRVRNDKEI